MAVTALGPLLLDLNKRERINCYLFLSPFLFGVCRQAGFFLMQMILLQVKESTFKYVRYDILVPKSVFTWYSFF